MLTHPAHATGGSEDPAIQAAAQKAVELIHEGALVGLGSGRAAAAFVAKLGALCQRGFRVSGVPTSLATAELARRAGVPLIELDTGGPLDLTVDGADEVAPNLDLLKGLGGALVRERIVAAASARQVILVDQGKLVQALGERGPVPVEVIPMAGALVVQKLKALGLDPIPRTDHGGSRPFVTENGNILVDCVLPQPLADGKAARDLQRALRAIVGVVDTGLFLGTADRVLVGHSDGRVDVLTRAEH